MAPIHQLATTAQGQCYICQRVVSVVHMNSGTWPTNLDAWENHHVPLSSWEELKSNHHCLTCSRIADLFKRKFKISGPRSATYHFLEYLFSRPPVVLGLSPLPLPVPRPHFIELYLKPLDERFADSAGVIMDPYWLDLERVSQWIKVCDTTHTQCQCSATMPLAMGSSQNMFFISVSRKCIVQAQLGERYIALSYVWGPQSSQYGATRAEFPFMRSEGSLSCPRIWECLPGTIRRAMQFASLLEVDLLWVDRLCIVQDDPVHIGSQINSMANVYSHAYFTLCAADGSDAESGLRGIPNSSKPRNLPQEIFTFHGNQMTSKMLLPLDDEYAVYDQRAWTLQETVLSRRILAFRNNGLHWRCHEMSCAEQERYQAQFSKFDPMVRQFENQWPSVVRWAELVFKYQQRKITYEHDVLRAFSGITEAMSGYMPGGFHFGLPELFFDMALLWVPDVHLTRREGAAIENEGFTFPSWSWAGWRGRLRGNFRHYEDTYRRPPSARRTSPRIGDIIPSVKWFKIGKDTSELIKICNDYDRYRDGGLRGDVDLQTGWSSHTDGDSGRKYYRYDMAHDFVSFWYPLPTIRHPQPAETHTYQSVLFCRTWRIYLGLGSATSHVEPDSRMRVKPPVHSVITRDGTWAGVLYVHRSEDLTRQDQQCELVAISSNSAFEIENSEEISGWIRNCFPEMDHQLRPRSGNWYHFYHLLWIEWQNGIAYRKGLARIAKSVYDHLPKEEIDLYLG